VLTEQVPGKKLFITFESVVNDKLAPVENGVTRMELAGSWTLEQVNPKHVKVTYRILSYAQPHTAHVYRPGNSQQSDEYYKSFNKTGRR
jgi:hypothetical protein